MRYSEYAYDEFDAIRLVPDVEVVTYDHDDIAGSSGSGVTLKVPIQAGTVVLGVGHLISEAFASDIAVKVGDADNDDGYCTASDLTMNSLNNFFFSQGSANELAQGKYYASASYLLVTFATSPATSGEAKLFIMTLSGMDGNWRVPAL